MRMFLFSPKASFGIAALIAGVLSADAAVVLTDRADFNATLSSGSYTEDFELVESGPRVAPVSLSSGAYAYTINAPGNLTAKLFVNNEGEPATKWISTWVSTDSITVNITSGNVTAVGADFFVTDFPGSLVTGSFNVSVNDGTTELIQVQNDGDRVFLGFVSASPITRLTLSAPIEGGLRFSTIDNLTVGSVVPEPWHTALASAALLAGWAVVRRSRLRARRPVRG